MSPVGCDEGEVIQHTQASHSPRSDAVCAAWHSDGCGTWRLHRFTCTDCTVLHGELRSMALRRP